MKIIMIRHGQTEWNVLQKYQGQTDIDLNDIGREQASKLANYFKEQDEEIEAIYCSDLSRCRETAAIIGAATGLQPLVDTRFREIHFGYWEGLTHSEVLQQYPQELDDWLHQTLKVKLSGGELIENVLERCLAGIEQISSRHQGAVIVVTHGGLIKILLNHLGAMAGEWKTYLQSGSMTILECRANVLTPIEIGLPVE